MANLPESATWINDVYQLEITDPVEGGLMGISNAQAKVLANRTRYLYDLLNKFMAPFVGGKGWVLFYDIVANIPDGWAEVTEMRGRIPFGLDSSITEFNAIGNASGSKNKTLIQANLPSNVQALHAPFPGITGGGGTGFQPWSPLNINIGGSSQAFSILNPYRVVTYIKYVG